jgi:hypothetical protein
MTFPIERLVDLGRHIDHPTFLKIVAAVEAESER